MKKILLSKGIVIAFGVFVITLLGIVLYRSYAINTGLSLGNQDNTYDILLTESSNTVTVPAKSSKTVYYQFSNTNKGTVKYSIGYTSDNVIAKVWWDTKDPISGTIEYGEYKFIKLKLINDTNSSDTITIKPVLGFVNGGNVIADSNTTLVAGTINETNTMSVTPTDALTTLNIDKANVKEVHFTNDNIPYSNSLGSTNMNSDGTVKLWYTNSDTNGMYNVYIGSDNGITTFKSFGSLMFNGFTGLSSIDFKYIDTSNVTSMYNMFYDCSSLTALDVSNFDTSKVARMDYMFKGCSNLTTLDLSNFDTHLVEDMRDMFSGCRNLTTLDVSNFDTHLVEDMRDMFSGCRNLTTLDVSNFDTSSVTKMNSMFYDCRSLTALNVSNFDTSLVTDMKIMFDGCSSLTTLDVSNFNTSNVSDMSSMFSGCTSLASIDVSNFDTSSATKMYYMFSGCSSLTTLDASSFVISNETDINSMFNGCSILVTIDMRSADLTNTTKKSYIFNNVPSNVTIYLKDTQGNRDYMINNYSSYTNVQYIS